MTVETTSREAQFHHKTYRETRHFGSLNGLRFLCIFAVVWHHAPKTPFFSDGATIWLRGSLGVDFFFVLSGFLITTLLLREEDRDGVFSLKGFYWRRMLRIIPPYFLVVTALGAYFIGVKGETQYLDLLPFYYLFMANFLVTDIPMLSPTWSLSVEEQYYLVWPLLLLLVPRRFIFHFLIALIVLNFVAITRDLRPFGIRPIEIYPLYIRMFVATYIPILLGSGLALLLHRPNSFAVLHALLARPWATPLSFMLLLVWLLVLPPDLKGWPNILVHTTMTLCLATLVIQETHTGRAFFTARPIARVGEISYGIYLYHLIGLHITTIGLTKLGAPAPLLIFVIYFCIAIVMAELSFRYFESFFLKKRYR